jgi:hypothetical protein
VADDHDDEDDEHEMDNDQPLDRGTTTPWVIYSFQFSISELLKLG